MQSAGLTPEAADQMVLDILAERISLNDVLPSSELYRAVDRYIQARGGSHSRDTSLNTEVEYSGFQRHTITSQRQRLQIMVDILQELFRGHTAAAADSTTATNNQADIPSRRSPPPQMVPTSTETWRRLPQPHYSSENEQRIPAAARHNRAFAGRLELQNAGQQLQSASQHLRELNDRELLNESLSFIQQPLTTREYAGEAETNRAIKRRKLESGESSPSISGFTPYGHYGQVEPGRLNMEIHSCDGGIFNDERGAKFAAENVLKVDKSVYCTKGNRCNLVLQHQGATPFTLTELIIKAPPRGYTAPVQEGMVFISMTSDDLLNRTAQYQIQYSSSKSCRRASQDRGPVSPRIFSIRHSRDGTERITRITDPRLRRFESSPTDTGDSRQAQIPDDFTHENSDSFHVTCECSDDEEETRSRRPPNRIGSLRFEESDNEDSEDDYRPWPDDYWLDRSSREPPSPVERRTEASSFSISSDLEAAQDAAQEATQEAVKAVGGGLMSPLCKFFIERDKNKCTMRFTPEVSGRFILLKLWSPIHERGGNIDIQNIIVKGFAGTRFFPSGGMR